MDETTKRCPNCREDKQKSDFGSNRARRDGLAFYCRECTRLRNRIYQSKPETRERNRSALADLYRNDPERYLNYRYRSRFGITLAEYNALLDKQGGVCAICGGQSLDGSRLAVDHDHRCCPGKRSCGQCVRGLLCGECNRALAKFHDDPAMLRRAADYVSN